MHHIDSAQAEILVLFEGIEASYTDGATTLSNVIVVPARFGTRQSVQKERVEVPMHRQELLVAKASLNGLEPIRGASFAVDFGTGTQVYRVAPEDNERTWEPSDPGGVLIRVRCVLES